MHDVKTQTMINEGTKSNAELTLMETLHTLITRAISQDEMIIRINYIHSRAFTEGAHETHEFNTNELIVLFNIFSPSLMCTALHIENTQTIANYVKINTVFSKSNNVQCPPISSGHNLEVGLVSIFSPT